MQSIAVIDISDNLLCIIDISE